MVVRKPVICTFAIKGIQIGFPCRIASSKHAGCSRNFRQVKNYEPIGELCSINKLTSTYKLSPTHLAIRLVKRYDSQGWRKFAMTKVGMNVST